VNSWVFGAGRGDHPAVRVPEQAGSSRLHAVFTGPPPTLHLAGDIDESTFPDLMRILAHTADAGASRIHVDLADVEYCDVAGLRAIISLASDQGEGRAPVDEIVFTRLPGPLQRVLLILGWDAVPGVILDGSSC
jgi:anti-anti-sigma factor